MNKLLRLVSYDVSRIIAVAALFSAAFLLELFKFEWVSFAIYILALIVAGGKVFFDAVRGIIRRDLLDEKFLMSIASVGAFIVGEYSEGVAVMLFFLIGEAFEHRAVRRSRNSIKALMDIRPDEASVLINGEEITLDSDDVEIGSTIVIRPGERVPIDCRILSGSADVDTSAITGESLPRAVKQGDNLDSGVIVINGLLRCETLRSADNSAAARILDLVENATENKSREESFITSFSRVYTPIVVGLAVVLAICLPLLRLATVEEAIYRALMFLVISCPCALVISVPMAFFGGIGGAASKGILFKGGNVFSKLARACAFAFDKTGTLTSGDFVVSDIITHGVSEDELRLLVASAEQGSNHPLATALGRLHNAPIAPDSYEEIAGEGIIATLSGAKIAVGNFSLMKRIGVTLPKEISGTVLISKDSSFIGEIIISDMIKPEAKAAIEKLHSQGAKRIAMISGDKKKYADMIAAQAGISEVYSELSPEDKYNTLKSIISESSPAVYVGDGINDTPSLALSDVGIAMGAIGQDSAIETADLVIMTDNLLRIPEAKRIASRTISIARFNIAFALTVKIAVMILGAFGIANMWLAVFADVGVAVLAILNAMRTLFITKK